MARVICPFCLKVHDFSGPNPACTERGEPIPDVYIREYPKVPPLWILTVGFTQHGKTTYLAALNRVMESLGKTFDGAFTRRLDNYTNDAIKRMYLEARQGKLSESSPPGWSRPLLLSIYDGPDGQNHCLVMYDRAGETYNNLERLQQDGTVIKEVSTIWFMVCLQDLEHDTEGNTLPDLFGVYLTGMEALRADMRGRNLIVIFTKADEYQFPHDIKQYLISDPYKTLTRSSAVLDDEETEGSYPSFTMDEYIAGMDGISQKLEAFTRKHVERGPDFIHMVKNAGMNLRFCITSALGQSPDQKTRRLNEDSTPCRVLDPFFWTIKLSAPPPKDNYALVLDAGPGSETIYASGMHKQILDRLSAFGEVTTYYLGRSRQVSGPGQSLPDNAPKVSYARLVGPILDRCDPTTRLLILTTNAIHDLEDFAGSTWRDRVLLVTMGEDYHDNWAHSQLISPGDDPLIPAEALLHLNATSEN